jgi:hypothetical protein
MTLALGGTQRAPIFTFRPDAPTFSLVPRVDVSNGSKRRVRLDQAETFPQGKSGLARI